jgi:hypothetical protein
MKKVIRNLGVLLLALVTVVSIISCSKDDDPVNNDFFAGTYNGHITYNEAGGASVDQPNGKVFVTKIASGTKYNFSFSDGIPDLNGIEFQQTGDHTLTSVGATSLVYIKINNNNLSILYSKDGKTWTANCDR